MKHIYTLLLLTSLLLTGCKGNPVESSSAVVNFTAPFSNDLAGDSVLVSINATSANGIAGVEFYIDGFLAKSWVVAPYSYYCKLSLYSDSSVHTFRAKAKTMNGMETWTGTKNVIIRKLKAPADAGFTHTGAYAYKLIWTDINNAETGYRIEVNKNNTGFTLLANIQANATEYSITNRDTLSVYEYRVAAFRDSVLSGYSGAIKIVYSGKNYITTASVKASAGVVNDMVLSADETSVWTVGSDGTMKQISLENASIIRNIQAHIGSAEVIALKKTGTSVFTAGTDKRLVEWSTVTGALIQLRTDLPVTPSVLSTSADNTKLVFTSTTSLAYIYNASPLSSIRQVSGDILATLWSAASPVDNYFITFGFNGEIRFFNFNESAPYKVLPTTIGRFGDISPSGTMFAMPDAGNTIAFMSISTGLKIVTASGHPNTINWIKYSTDGSLLGSCADDKTVKVWKTSDGSLYCNVTGETDKVTRLLLTGNGAKLITCGTDGIIRIRQLGSGWSRQ